MSLDPFPAWMVEQATGGALPPACRVCGSTDDCACEQDQLEDAGFRYDAQSQEWHR